LILFTDERKDPVFLCAWLTYIGLKEGTWIKDVRVLDRDPLAKLSWWANTLRFSRRRGSAKARLAWKKSLHRQHLQEAPVALPNVRFKAADEIFQLARMIKEPEEIKIIKESVLIAEAGLRAG